MTVVSTPPPPVPQHPRFLFSPPWTQNAGSIAPVDQETLRITHVRFSSRKFETEGGSSLDTACVHSTAAWLGCRA